MSNPKTVLGIAVFVLFSSHITVASAGEPKNEPPKNGPLFNGRDLAGWTFVSSDGETKAEDVWAIENEDLICNGNPIGYLRTKADYENYRLKLQWRWKPGGKAGNGGVLVHTLTPNEVWIWPKSVEIQLQSTNAGDLVAIGTDFDVENEATRRKELHSVKIYSKLVEDSENPIGEWNLLEIICRGSEIMVRVNGVLVNHATDCRETKGAICLQSEGAEMHFRDIQLFSLED